MATDPPSVIAKGIVRKLSVPPHTGTERDLQRLFSAENVEEIWDEILSIVQAALPPHARGDDTIAQDVFLHLMALQSFDDFSIQKFSDQEIRNSVLALLREDLQKSS